MYCNTLAFAFALEPSTTSKQRRTLLTTLAFATGALYGWPFGLAVAIPFVFEELFLLSGDRVTAENKTSWMITRWKWLFICGAVASLLIVSLCSSMLVISIHA